MTVSAFLLLLLLLSITSGLWYKHTDNDIFAVLAVACIAACLFWGLVLAHWSINLLGLLVLLRFKSPILGWAKVKIN